MKTHFRKVNLITFSKVKCKNPWRQRDLFGSSWENITLGQREQGLRIGQDTNEIEDEGRVRNVKALGFLLWKCAKCLAKDVKGVRHQDFRGSAKIGGDICCGLGLHN